MDSNQKKFVASIIITFAIPALAYIHGQGAMSESIHQLTRTVENFQNTIDNLSDKIDAQGNRLTAIETRQTLEER